MTTIETTSLRDYLAQTADIRRKLMKPVEGYAYQSMEDFVLQHGQEWTPAPRPKGVRKRARGQCFANSYRLVDSTQGRRLELRYVEGYALSVIPLQHAWAVTPDGIVVDTTWDGPEDREYFGIAFPIELVRAAIYLKKYYGVIDDWHNDFPLLHEPYDPDSALVRLRELAHKKR